MLYKISFPRFSHPAFVILIIYTNSDHIHPLASYIIYSPRIKSYKQVHAYTYYIVSVNVYACKGLNIHASITFRQQTIKQIHVRYNKISKTRKKNVPRMSRDVRGRGEYLGVKVRY